MDAMDDHHRESPKYRALQEETLAVLTMFEKATEWADLVKCLQRLNKALVKYSQLPVIPERHTVARRLAQCLNPALPSGVHLKALETYELIFVQIGSDRLGAQLPSYSVGLFPFLRYGAVQAKFQALQLYEKHFLTLGRALSVCLPGLVAALLPGLDPESQELHSKVYALLDRVRDATDPHAFHAAVWRALLLVSHARLTALTFVIQRFPKPLKTSDVAVFMPSRSLTLNALCAALLDSNVLVQRTALDVLCTIFPPDGGVLEEAELADLLKAMLQVALRREQSLNRRLYGWILGGSEFKADFFAQFVRAPLFLALHSVFAEIATNTTAATASRPYKMAMAMFSKPELFAAVSADVVMDILHRLSRFKTGYSCSAEVIQNATSLLQQYSPNVVWDALLSNLEADLHMHRPNAHVEQAVGFVTGLLELLLSTCQLPNADAVRTRLLELVVTGLRNRLQVVHDGLALLIDQCTAINSLVSFAVHVQNIFDVAAESRTGQMVEDHSVVMHGIVSNYVIFFRDLRTLGDTGVEQLRAVTETFRVSMQLMLRLCQHVGVESPDVVVRTVEELPSWLQALLDQCLTSFDARMVLNAMEAVLDAVTMSGLLSTSAMQLMQSPEVLERFIVQELWGLIDIPAFTETSTSLFLRAANVSTATTDSIIRNLALRLVAPDAMERAGAGRKFCSLWSAAGHQQLDALQWAPCVFLMVDMLDDLYSTARYSARSWLQNAYGNIDRLFDPLIVELLRCAPPTKLLPSGNDCPAHLRPTYGAKRDAKRGSHLARAIRAIVRADTAAFARTATVALASETLKSVTIALAPDRFGELLLRPPTYLALLVALCIRYMQDDDETMQVASAYLLHSLLSNMGTGVHAAHTVHLAGGAVLACLAAAIDKQSFSMQRVLLDCVTAVVGLQSLTASVPLRSNSTDDAGSFSIPTHHHHLCQQPAFIHTIVRALQRCYEQEHVHSTNSSNSPIWHTPPGGQMPIASLQRTSVSSAPSPRTAEQETDATFMYSHWVDFISNILHHIVQFSAADTGALLQCYAELVLKMCGAVVQSRSRSGSNARSAGQYAAAVKPPSDEALAGQRARALVSGISVILEHCVLSETNTAAEESSPQKTRLSAVLAGVSGIFGRQEAAEEVLPDAPVLQAKVAIMKHLTMSIEAIIRVAFLRRGTAVDIQQNVVLLLDDIMRKHPAHVVSAFLNLWRTEAPGKVKEGSVSIHGVVIDLLQRLSSAHSELVWEGAAAIVNCMLSGGASDKPQKTATTQLSYLDSLSMHFTTDVLLHWLNSTLPVILKRHPLSANSAALQRSWQHLYNVMHDLLWLGRSLTSYALLLRLMDEFVRSTPDDVLLDKKLRRELQELMQKAVDLCAQLAGKTIDIPVTAPLVSAPVSAPQTATEPLAVTRYSSASSKPPDSAEEAKIQHSLKCCRALAALMPQLLLAVFDDRDRAIPLVQSVHARIAPMLRLHGPGDLRVAAAVVAVVASLKQSPFTHKVWRKDVLEALQDADFFVMIPGAVRPWCEAVNMVMTSDTTAIQELLARLSAATDAVSRARALKRVAFVLYSGVMDQYVDMLSTIQDKLFETLRAAQPSVAHIAAFLCLRVFVSRFSATHVQPLWSAVLADMIRLFNEAIDPSVLLAVLKFVDMALLLYPTEMQHFKWVFLSDSVMSDDMLAEQTFAPYADRLLGVGRLDSAEVATQPLGRPVINARTVVSMQQLQPLVDALRAHTHAGAPIDYAHIDSLFETDFVEAPGQ